MIVRTWQGRTWSSDAETYRNYMIRVAIPEITSTKGNLGAQIWQQKEGDITHVHVVSWWRDMESIKAFSGEDTDLARYYDEDKKYLLELDPHVRHYEAWDFR